jgi:hypothetical protein
MNAALARAIASNSAVTENSLGTALAVRLPEPKRPLQEISLCGPAVNESLSSELAALPGMQGPADSGPRSPLKWGHLWLFGSQSWSTTAHFRNLVSMSCSAQKMRECAVLHSSFWRQVIPPSGGTVRFSLRSYALFGMLIQTMTSIESSANVTCSSHIRFTSSSAPA